MSNISLACSNAIAALWLLRAGKLVLQGGWFIMSGTLLFTLAKLPLSSNWVTAMV